MRVDIIGLGGVGLYLLDPLARYLGYHPQFRDQKTVINLVDGDTYAVANLSRQYFKEVGNKAKVTCDWMRTVFPIHEWYAYPMYLHPQNAESVIKDGDIVLSCVDNHVARKALSNYVGTLQEALLIAGGNEYEDGGIQVYHRKAGQDASLPLDNDLHPEIQNPDPKLDPIELMTRVGCEELAVVSEPQLVLANLNVATMMLNALYGFMKTGEAQYDEGWFGIHPSQSRVERRIP